MYSIISFFQITYILVVVQFPGDAASLINQLLAPSNLKQINPLSIKQQSPVYNFANSTSNSTHTTQARQATATAEKTIESGPTLTPQQGSLWKAAKLL